MVIDDVICGHFSIITITPTPTCAKPEQLFPKDHQGLEQRLPETVLAPSVSAFASRAAAEV
jgi:hypothetical protein